MKMRLREKPVRTKKFLVAGLSAWTLIAGYAALRKIQAQNFGKTVEICIPWNETREMVDREPQLIGNSPRTTFLNFLERCSIIGARSAALQEEIVGGKNAGFSSAQVSSLKSLGFSAVYLVDENGPFIKTPQIWPPLPEESAEHVMGGTTKINLGPDPEMVKSWVFMPDSPDLAAVKLHFNDDIVEAAETSGASFILLENQPKTYEQVRILARRLPKQVVRAHTITAAEMKGMSREMMMSRWMRAVRERSCKCLYIHWNPVWSAEDNLTFLRDLAKRLKSDGFSLELSQNTLSSYVEYPLKKVRMALAWILSVLAPLAALAVIKKSLSAPEEPLRFRKALKIWGMGAAIAVLGGISLSALLSDSVFVNGLDIFRGVKASLVLPIAFAGPLLLSVSQMEDFLNRKITVMDLLAVLIVAAGLALMVERSGNLSSHVSAVELGLREKLEAILGTRPRFKEFLFGHPLLIAGIYFKRNKPLSAACLWAGMIGLVSILNSFCHLHCPLSVTLLRTFHGLWLGAVIGAGLVKLVNFWLERQRAASPLAL